MVIHAKRWRFNPELVADAPAHAGIYALWDGDALVRLGCARGGETIRSKLLAVLVGAGPAPTHYSWEIHVRPGQRAKEIVRELEGG